MFIFLIIIGIIIYLFIIWATFRICAANDVFEEFSGRKIYDFPTATFFFSLFWIIMIPISLICALFSWIAEEIASWGYVYYRIGEEKRLAKKRNKKKEDER